MSEHRQYTSYAIIQNILARAARQSHIKMDEAVDATVNPRHINSIYIYVHSNFMTVKIKKRRDAEVSCVKV